MIWIKYFERVPPFIYVSLPYIIIQLHRIFCQNDQNGRIRWKINGQKVENNNYDLRQVTCTKTTLWAARTRTKDFTSVTVPEIYFSRISFQSAFYSFYWILPFPSSRTALHLHKIFYGTYIALATISNLTLPLIIFTIKIYYLNFSLLS